MWGTDNDREGELKDNRERGRVGKGIKVEWRGVG